MALKAILFTPNRCFFCHQGAMWMPVDVAEYLHPPPPFRVVGMNISRAAVDAVLPNLPRCL